MRHGIRVSGDLAIPPRGERVYRLDEPIYCPQGHRLGETAGFVPHGWVRCTKRIETPAGRMDICNEILYVCDFGDGTIGVARIDWKEAYHIRKLQCSMSAAADFLQLPWARSLR